MFDVGYFPPRAIVTVRVSMAGQSVISRKKRGPPPSGKGKPILVRLQPPQLAALDAWIAEQEGALSRPQAIRRLVESGLASGTAAPRQRSKESKRKAAELAGQEIDRLGDDGLTGEEKATRKRRLIKGPREFRDVRGDLPKKKS